MSWTCSAVWGGSGDTGRRCRRRVGGCEAWPGVVCGAAGLARRQPRLRPPSGQPRRGGACRSVGLGVLAARPAAALLLDGGGDQPPRLRCAWATVRVPGTGLSHRNGAVGAGGGGAVVSVPAVGLSRRTLGSVALWLFAAGASSPMTVVAASVPATYAATGVLGVPLSFLVLGPVLGLVNVGYVAVARQVPHAAASYSVLVHGLGRVVGVAGAAVAVLAYAAVGICLHGLIGATLAEQVGGLPWWGWAVLAWAAVGLLGVYRVRLNTIVLGLILGIELVLIVGFDVAALTHPADGQLSATPFAPSQVLGKGIGAVIVLGVGALIGWEQPPVYAEEARHPSSAPRATFAALGVLCVLYAASAWALATVVGMDQVADAAQDPAVAFTAMQTVFGPLWGPVAAGLAQLLLIGSMFGAMLAFHSGVARHLFALGRDGVLPQWLGRAGAGTGHRSGAPVAGSLTQSAAALAVIAIFAAADADPVKTLFSWLATIAAVAVLGLLTACCLAAVVFFARRGRRPVAPTGEGVWTRLVGPLLGLGCGTVVLVVTVTHLGTLLGVADGSAATRVVPGVVAAAAVAGLAWALWLRRHRPSVYGRIGAGRPDPLLVIDQRLTSLEV
jgi:amino acid transporter